jgi:glutamyl-tRNA reductase
MTGSNAPKTPAEIKFRVDRAEKAQADQIAASVGMDTNTAMKVMFKRFIAERGFPFDMKAPAHVQGPLGGAGTAFGVSVDRLAQMSAAGFAHAAEAHEKAGRRPSRPVAAVRRNARHR